MKAKLLLMLCLLATVLSCDKDGISNEQQNDDDPTNFSEYFGNETTRSFIGKVIDVNENPIENVSISIGNVQVETDAQGVFIVQDAPVNERFAYIKAEKSGYIHGSRSVNPTAGTNKISIMLLEEIVAGTTSSGEQKTISIANGASVSLNGNYIKEDGTAYSGSLDVIVHHLDPTDDMVTLQMPGMLYAENTENEERMLITLGMLAVELRGGAGEDLNIADGSSAEIKIPVDASLMATAPTTIPLWYFDEAKGYWIEEGEATLVGNNYVGTVTHFSFWNCDIPAEAINLCVTVVDENGFAVANSNVTITSSTFGTRGGYTNDTGEVCGLVPSGETLEINVHEFDICGSNAIYTAAIGPYTSDSTLDVTITNSSDIISETVTGVFNDCNDNPVIDGYVVLNYGNQQFFSTVTDGIFEINMLRCSSVNAFTIEAIDYDNLQTTGEINYTFNSPETNLGDLNACNAITEFIQYTIDGDPNEKVFIATNIQASFDDTGSANFGLSISGQGEAGSNNCFYLFGVLNDAPYVGTYNAIGFDNSNDPGMNIGECIYISSDNNSIIFNLTALGNVGDYIDINFSGDYEDRNGNPHSITGIVHVIRD